MSMNWEAVAAVGTLDRPACREDVEKRFSRTRMAGEYVRVYEEILKLEAKDEHQAHSDAV